MARVSGVHLVGSVPLENAEAVMRMASEEIGSHLQAIPDGETGARTSWIGWQYPRLAANPLLEPDPEARPTRSSGQPEAYIAIRPLRLRPDADPARLRFDDLGYADHALESYATFSRLKRDGVIPPRMRFQVSIASPYAPVNAWVIRASQPAVIGAYERAILAEVARITSGVPHHELALQWDVMNEVLVFEGFPSFESDPRRDLIARLARIGEAVPAPVLLGYHLCYGDPGHKHIVEPKDTRVLVEMANAIAARVTRRIDWIHLPVPRNRQDEAYYAALAGLSLAPETRLFLGLVHYTDGVPGTLVRLRQASPFVPEFGIATECGFGRRHPSTIRDLMAIHREVVEQA